MTQLAELGQILMAIGNIASKCQRKKVVSDERPIGDMNLEEKLEVIRDYLNDQNDVYKMADELNRNSRSAEGSGRRRPGRVHFSD